MAQVRHKVVNEAWSVIRAVDDNADGDGHHRIKRKKSDSSHKTLNSETGRNKSDAATCRNKGKLRLRPISTISSPLWGKPEVLIKRGLGLG
jgi:hypothetical protein